MLGCVIVVFLVSTTTNTTTTTITTTHPIVVSFPSPPLPLPNKRTKHNNNKQTYIAQTTCFPADTTAQKNAFKGGLYYRAKSSDSYSARVLHYLLAPTTAIRGAEDPDFGFSSLQNAYRIATGK